MVPLAVPFNSFANALVLIGNCVLATVIVVLNALVFTSIIITRSLRRENRFIYMMSTCISDFGTGVSWYYVGLFDVEDVPHGKNNCYFIASSFLGLSYLVILAAQADRYHAIVSPFRYAQRMSTTRTLLVICCLWLYTYINLAIQNLISSSAHLLWHSTGTLICNIITLVIMIGLNTKLCFIAKFQIEREPPSEERESKRASLYLIIVVVGFFLLFWMPVFMYIVICYLTTVKCYKFENSGTDPLKILARINCAVTPFLYVRGCAPLKAVLYQRVLRCGLKQQRKINSGVNKRANSIEFVEAISSK
ncbi:phe13-bombesin receptor-like isoform X1 [Erpetoichthys calabaricus]|uniref:phe13-bombesin receptor-like isoform X1 n=1 Tax=Erpetoichthys calabaricus TaxID=27687 RepID=UPI0022342579|nr:phe13-bombesin receptor-like isoform X1 [Erpetoichthys calabaricus]